MHPRETWVTFQLARRETWHPASQGHRWDVMEYDWMWWRKMAVIAVVVQQRRRRRRCCAPAHMKWCEETWWKYSPVDEWKSVWTKSECWWTDKRCDEFKYNLIWLNKYFMATWEPAASQQRWWMVNGSGGNPHHIYILPTIQTSTPYVRNTIQSLSCTEKLKPCSFELG